MASKRYYILFLLVFSFVKVKAQFTPRNFIPDVNAFTQIGSNTNSNGQSTPTGANFGFSISVIGDIDSDGVQDIVVGAPKVDEAGGNTDIGAVYVIRLNTDRTVKAWNYISESTSGGTISLDPSDQFGYSVAGIGDIDNDGIGDIAVGAINDGASDKGAVYIIRLNSTGGIVGSVAKIADGVGSLSLSSSGNFGNSLCAIGDLNGDGRQEIIAGCHKDDVGIKTDAGSAFVLNISSTGTLNSFFRIVQNVQGGLPDNTQDTQDYFGTGVTGIGDFDGDGIPDIAVSAIGDDDGATDKGAIYLLAMESDLQVKSIIKKISNPISSSTSYFLTASTENFGRSLKSTDLNGDGIKDMLIGAYKDAQIGSVYSILLKSDGSILDARRIGNRNGWSRAVTAGEYLGTDFTYIEDIESDGKMNFIIGAPGVDISSNVDAGSIFILNMNTTTSSLPGVQIVNYHKISAVSGAFSTGLSMNDNLGMGVISIGDINGDGINDLGVGAPLNDEGTTTNCGGYWICLMDQYGKVSSKVGITSGTSNFVTLAYDDRLGYAACALGDIDSDGVPDIAIGAPMDDDVGYSNSGAVYVVRLNSDGSVKGTSRIGCPNLPGTNNGAMNLGVGLGSPGDLNNDGRNELIIGANLDDQGGTNSGAIFVCFLNSDGSYNTGVKIYDGYSSGNPVIPDGANFGGSIIPINDFNGDGTEDIIVSATQLNSEGGFYIIYLNSAGNAIDYKQISTTATGTLPSGFSITDGTIFGCSLAILNDLDGNGVNDIAIGHTLNTDYGVTIGQLWIGLMDATGNIIELNNIGPTNGRFYGVLDQDDQFALAMTCLGDINKDGSIDLAVGARYDDDGATNTGAVWILGLSSHISSQKQYVEADLKLDGSYYFAWNDVLLFRFEEEYNVVNGTLSCSIFGNHLSYTIPSLTTNRGMNFYAMDVSFLPSGYYTLSVRNSKNESRSLRFKKM